jgi:hypothetical protein
MTDVTTVPALIFSSKTLSIGSHMTILGTTYSLGSAVLHVDGKPKTLTLNDDQTIITLPNGMITTVTESAVTLLLSSNPSSGTSAGVTGASSTASDFRLS